MARNYQRDDRYSRRGQQQNSPDDDRWSGNRRDDDYDWNEQQGQESGQWRRHGQQPNWRSQNQQDDREWRGQNQERRDWRNQGQEGQNWGQNWGREDDWRGRSEMDDRWSRNQGMQGGGQRPWGGNMQRPWGGNMDRENRERNYGMGQSSNWNELSEGYGQLGGRGWYEGYEDAMHRERGQHTGRGPRNYKRSDSRIEEDVNDRLTQHSMIDASDIEVSVQNGEVTLKGHTDSRQAKRLAEEIAESVFGAKEVNNQIKVKQRSGFEESKSESESSGKQRKAS